MSSLQDHQIELERLFSKNQLIPRIKAEFTNCAVFNFEHFLKEVNIPILFGIDMLTQMALHKRASMATMVGCLRHHCNTAQEVADLLLLAAENNLVNYDVSTQTFIVNFTLSDDVQAELDRFQYPLPMVVEPKEVKCNRDTGYLTTSGSIILKNNHHNDDVCLEHINHANRVEFVINATTAKMVKNRWRNLDKPKQGETVEEFQKRKKAFEKYDSTAKDVIDLLLKEGNSFFLTHKYDKRGRIYCQGYHVNYQGASWNKAVLEFAKKEQMVD
jgi:hypothetical protein